MLAPFAPKQTMLLRSLRAVLCAMILTAAFSATANADEAVVAARGGIEAKIEYCKTCHGLAAQGYRGWSPMPRLAGQQPQYVENQLRSFMERRRTNPIMANVVRALSPSMISALAAHFSHLDAKPIGGAPRRPIALGKKIFEEGLPETNVPACSACHGEDAKGQREVPRLAGQLYEYTVGQLSGWVTGRHPSESDSPAIMTPTTHNLTRAQIEAVAAYVSYLK